MGEKNLWSKVGLIVLLVGLSIWQIWPPEKNLKPGIDLGGGYSALFEIDDTNAKDDPHLAQKVMDILKQRIDPGSTRNLVWRPVGRNRLEIQMPRARGETGAREYQAVRDKLLATNITEAEVRAALALAPEARDAKFADLVRGISARKPLFEQLAKVDDQYRQAVHLAESQPATTQPTTSTRPDQEIGAILDNRAEMVDKLLATNLSVPALVDRLELGKQSKSRAAEIEAIKKAHPDLAGTIDEMVVAYDKWSERKGVLEDPADLLRLLKGAGVLEFRILATRDPSNPDMLQSPKPEYNERAQKYIDQLAKRGPRPEAGDKYAWFKIAKPRENSIKDAPGYYVLGEYLGVDYVLAHATPDMGLLNDKSWSLVAASPDRDPTTGRLAVAFQLDQRGGDKFSELTSTNLKRPLAIFLDEEAISAATIQSRISTRGQITGTFTPQEVSYLVQTLEAGALPARLKEVPIQERNVGPSLGETNIRKGLTAVTVSILAVIALLAIYYTYNGAIADIALLMNLIITLGIMCFIGATFTLPGIAGLILSLGMSVDANVLIYERMREELQRGVSVRMAVKLGYERAFSAIFDGNVTAIITAAILYWIGSEEIKGFGLTLGIALAISMFTALFVTRQYYYVMIPQTLNRDETKKAWLLPAILILIASVMLALGWVINRSALDQSNAFALGQFLGVIGLTAAVILASMWGFRALYRLAGHQKANRLPMLQLMSTPNLDWMKHYKKYWTGSAVVILAGLIFMAGVWKEVLDIEFVGGTNVQVELKDQYKGLSDEDVRQQIVADKETSVVSWLRNAADQLRKAEVKPAGEARYIVSIPDGSLSQNQLQALLSARLFSGQKGDPTVERSGIVPVQDGGVAVQFLRTGQVPDQAAFEKLVREGTAEYAEAAARRMRDARIQSVQESGTTAFDIITTETARTLVGEALMASSLGEMLEVKHSIEAALVTDPERAPDGVFPVSRDDNVLADVIGGNSQADISAYKGGLVLVFDRLDPPATIEDVRERLKQMRMQPDFEATGWRSSEVFGLEAAGTVTVKKDGRQEEVPTYSKLAIAVVDTNLIYAPDGSNETWQAEVAGREKALAQAALGSSQSLQRVTTFLPQVASEAAQKAIIASVLSFIALIVYLWIRFGSLEFGVAGIIALYHDAAISLAALMACHYIHDTWLGNLLMLSDFKFDLTILAAVLTIVGYQINDTIVIFDRIRENRGRLGTISPQLINDSLNQTLSRTVLLVSIVLMTLLIMYVLGGEGIHGFAFIMIVGSISGTYTTLCIATPMLMHPRAMWITAIAIAVLTTLALTWQIESDVLRWSLVLVVAALGGLGAYRQLAAARQEQTGPAPARRPATA